jgi:hydroxymethylglutaryl-CoA reductase (NADPH)
MPSAMRAAAVKRWLGDAQNYKLVEEAFNSTTSYGRLESVDATIAGRNVVREIGWDRGFRLVL